MWVKTGLRAQLSHFLWLLECLWSVYKHLYQITIRNQFDTLLTDGVDTSKGQTDIPYQGEHHILTEQSKRNLVKPVVQSYHINIGYNYTHVQQSFTPPH